MTEILPLVRWGDAAFSIDEPREWQGRSTVTLRVSLFAPDSRETFDDPLNPRDRFHVPKETIAEAGLFDIPDEYPTLDEALHQFRRAARLLVLHEVDESLRFGEKLWFDPHTKERERYFPPTEEWP